METVHKIETIDRKKRSSQKFAFGFFTFLSYLVVAILFVILGFIIIKGGNVISWDFLTKAPEEGMTKGGIYPAIIGTFYLIVGSSIISFPIGIMSGIYMNEYAANSKLVRFIRIMTNNLSGVPSVVFGLFGMSLFVNALGWGDSIIAGSFTLALMSLPLIIRTTEEALKSIDDSFRHGSLALGATKLQTIRRVVLPMAFPNIITGKRYTMSRPITDFSSTIPVDCFSGSTTGNCSRWRVRMCSSRIPGLFSSTATGRHRCVPITFSAVSDREWSAIWKRDFFRLTIKNR